MTFFANLSKSWRQLLGVGLICCAGTSWSDLAFSAQNEAGKNDAGESRSANVEVPKAEGSKEADGKSSSKSGSEASEVKSSGPADQDKNQADPAKSDAGAGKSGAEKKNERKSAGNKAGAKKSPVESSAEKGKSKSPDQNADTNAGAVPEKKDAVNDATRDKVKGNNPKSNAPKGANLKGGEITPELETQALEFAAKQHPELVGLISPLKTTNPKEYQRAVRELFRTSERLDNIRLREPARYDLELDAWKLQSHVRLLAARLVMEPEPELQKSLKEAIRQKADNHVRLLQFEKESLKNRLEQIDRNIEKSTKSLDQTVDQEYERLLKQASRDKPVVQKQKKAKANPEVPKVESGVR